MKYFLHIRVIGLSYSASSENIHAEGFPIPAKLEIW